MKKDAMGAFIFICVLFSLVSCSGDKMSDMSITNLRCEYRTNPLGIDEVHPRLSWELESGTRGQKQTAYRIIVASSPDILARGEGDLWDTGKVKSDKTSQVMYDGAPLKSRQRCHWKVWSWDKDGRMTESDDTAQWIMGMVPKAEWEAEWIAMENTDAGYVSQLGKNNDLSLEPPSYFRKDFTVGKQVKHAYVHATALGLYELHINGERIGNDYFTPGWTQYNKRLQYQTYDITDNLQEGQNAVGVILGEGWYSGHLGWQNNRWIYGTENSLLVQVVIEYADGTTGIVGTDRTWQCAKGPIQYSSLYMGEKYDAGKEMPGWDRQAFDSSSWAAALEKEAPDVIYSAQRSQPVHIVETIAPVSMTEPAEGKYVFDLGQNIVGWARLTVSVPQGTEITIRFAERLDENGMIYTENLRGAKATDSYIAKGEGEEVYEPHFTFHGFQYVELSGLPEKPDMRSVTGVAVQSDTPRSGMFECSNQLVNKLYSNIVWGQRDNFLSVPTDCPQRDERLGWTGDAQTFIRTATYNMDVSAFFTKWMYDVEDSQTPAGAFSNFAPSLTTGPGDWGPAPAWSDAGIIVPWTIFRMYGDTRIIKAHWDAMSLFMNLIMKDNTDYIRKNNLGANFGDWLSINDDTPKYLIATAFWAQNAIMMSEMADAAGYVDEAEHYRELYKNIRSAFQKRYVATDGRVYPLDGDLEKTGAYAGSHAYTPGIGESQTGYLLALAADLVPPELKDQAANHLVRKIRDNNWHLSSGFVGVRFLNPVLSQTGHNDVAYRLLLTDTYPSWLYPVRNGATTIWERWDGWTDEKGFQDPGMNSFNHYSLGSVGEWLYRYVAGIEPDPEVPGFKQFVIKPYPDRRLEYARASYHSMHGTIESGWEIDGDTLELTVTVPANTTATVYVPAVSETDVMEGNMPAAKSEGVTFRLFIDGRAIYTVDSGTYRFTCSMPEK